MSDPSPLSSFLQSTDGGGGDVPPKLGGRKMDSVLPSGDPSLTQRDPTEMYPKASKRLVRRLGVLCRGWGVISPHPQLLPGDTGQSQSHCGCPSHVGMEPRDTVDILQSQLGPTQSPDVGDAEVKKPAVQDWGRQPAYGVRASVPRACFCTNGALGGGQTIAGLPVSDFPSWSLFPIGKRKVGRLLFP